MPFENLSIHRGEPILLEYEWLYEKIVARRRGGFCYELNGLFAALLRALGFRVDLLAARVYSASGVEGIPFDHLTLRVRLHKDWLADVGFGDSFCEPLPLCAGPISEQRAFAYRLETMGERLVLTRSNGGDSWQRQYVFALQPYELADFAGGCAYHQTSTASHFARGRICTRATADGRVSLSEGKRTFSDLHGNRDAHRRSRLCHLAGAGFRDRHEVTQRNPGADF